jgi:Ala-tRNA(Pro) deacylase
MRIPQFLTDHQVQFETIVHPPAFTASHRAKHLALPGRQVAKGVLLIGPRGFVLAVLPATFHIDTQALSRELGGDVRLATPQEIANLFRDCEWGVVTPFGAPYGVPTLLDESFPPDTLLVFEGHTHGVALRLRCRDFERLERPRRLALSRRELA